MSLLLVALGAALGAAGRWLVDRFVQSRHTSFFPWGTFVVNIVGSLLLGLLLGARSAPDLVLVLGSGFCGGFTTFSTFSFETVVLAGEGRGAVARAYVVASLIAGLGAAYLGWWLGSTIA